MLNGYEIMSLAARHWKACCWFINIIMISLIFFSVFYQHKIAKEKRGKPHKFSRFLKHRSRQCFAAFSMGRDRLGTKRHVKFS